MTPKEKAKDLVDKFTAIKGNPFFSNECALIAVDEIIKSNPHSPSEPLEIMQHFFACKYWEEVKQEIVKLS